MSTWRPSHAMLGRAMLVAAMAAVAVLVPAARSQREPSGSAGGSAEANPRAALRTPPRKPEPKKAKEALKRGLRAEEASDWESAYEAYSDAVDWAPDDRDYLLRREIAKSHLVQAKVDAAERDAISGRLQEARRELIDASYLDPTNMVVRDRLTELSALEPRDPEETPADVELAGPVQLDYEPGTRNFDFRGDTQGAYDEMARQFGVQVAFDVDLPSRPVRFQIQGVDFPTAARLLGDMTGTFWRPLTKRLFFVAEDTPQKRRDYEVSVVRTVPLPASVTPDQMTETLRVVRDITGITRAQLDTDSRTLTLRASPHAIAVASDLIDSLQKPAGQMILEIEILEVDRNYARQLGITPPQTSRIFALNSQQIQEAQQSVQGLVDVISQVFGLPSSLSGLTASQITSLLSSGQLSAGSLVPPVVAFGGGMTTFLATMPGAAANFAEMLSLVQHGRRVLLRAEDGEPATFFVGDRIPVELSAFTASLSGTGVSVTGVSSSNFPVTNYATGAGPTFVATASLRNNSKDDLMVSNFTDNTVSVLPGNGDGTFGSQTTFPTGAGPTWIATGKFRSANGDIDLAVANQNDNTISILLGNGDGTFQPKTDIPAGSGPVSVVAANLHDLSGAGNLDLAVANHGDNTIFLYRGNGDGTFQAPTKIQLPAGFAPAAIATADFNGDGHTDLAVADEGNNTVSVFLGNGDGTFRARTDYATGRSPVWVSAASLRLGTITDLAVANKGDNTVSVLLGNASSNGSAGDGTFGVQTVYPAGAGPTSIATADYNIDGLPDLAVTDQTDNAISLLLNLGLGTFGPNFELPVGTSPVAITTADFNADSRADVAVANNGSNNASVILNSSAFSLPSLNPFTNTGFPGVQYIDVGLKVKATPRVHRDNEVTLQLEFEISSLSGTSINAIPVISSDTISQTVRVKENQTAILAGLLQRQTTNILNGTPGIAAIPEIGLFASNKNTQNQDSELLILVTPRMVRLAPRSDQTIYAGQGSLEGTGQGAVNEGPVRVQPVPGPPSPQPAPAQPQLPAQPPMQPQPAPQPFPRPGEPPAGGRPFPPQP